MRFKCSKCGECCILGKEYESENKTNEDQNNIVRKIIVYPEEADLLLFLAEENNIKFQFTEDSILPDAKNKNLIIVRYSIEINEENKTPPNSKYNTCPFFLDGNCIIYDNRPLSCRAYPLSVKEVNPYKLEIEINQNCKTFQSITNKDNSEINNLNELKKLFPIESNMVIQLFNREKKINSKLKYLQEQELIDLDTTITPDEFNFALESWERKKLYIDEI